jgi:hypothetical protein
LYYEELFDYEVDNIKIIYVKRFEMDNGYLIVLNNYSIKWFDIVLNIQKII